MKYKTEETSSTLQEAPQAYRIAGGLVGSMVGAKGKELSSGEAISRIREGLPFKDLTLLQTVLGVPMETLAEQLGISKATLHRRKAQGRLKPDESDRVVRFARLMGKATEVLESRENARLWLGAPQRGLGGAIPLNYAETEIGAREVEDLLGRIEYGVYS